MAFFPANFMLQTSQDQEDEDGSHNHQEQQHSIFPPQDDFNGKRTMLLSGRMEQCNGCEDTNNEEDELQKNRRLNMEQLQTLEKSFEMGKRLEPERKVQLARALGLQPRQIVIWFQNRRARWKTKQLEKDYDALKTQFDAVKARNEALQAQNQKLQSQILRLTSGGEATE